ncbi:1-acyl-sn-glycerol-3-phosphate acyltransferase [Fodinibius sp.]|uniref:1-acyl-sn-glycerol-3-phosphate acyltransferase n=1 Tax=Fodinibius sp. TaxID=1872440 RepID=UPI002ACE02C5|nr:1-acyl-sn-glycerol-3-phosphate acyltransferase [Fodinibius sp.]MDZ7659980.1 1-acyl-sn-glycerol-3-phosphate acyltransferase [Fodinibius sp.]
MRKNYLWYQFFRYGIIRPALNLFYSDITVIGREHVPENKPVMFIANHQNSFLDALHIVNNTRHFVHFLTRAEAYGNPILDRFFYSLNMLPVYRARDGFGTIKRNEQIFEECYERLARNDALLVFAEASHVMERRIRPLSKGFTRIVFGVEEKYNWDLDLQIVPVGISYGKHRKSRSPVRIEFGEVVPALQYKKEYRVDEREAAHALKMEIADRLKNLTLHIPNKKHYALYQLMLDELEPNRKELLEPELVNRRATVIAEHLNGELVEESEFLLEKADQYDITLQEVANPVSIGMKDIILIPLYAFSMLNNALPYQLVRWLVNSYLEDEAFEASVKFIVGLLLPFYYLAIALILYLVGLDTPWIVAYVLGSLVTASLFVRGKDLLVSKLIDKKKRSTLLDNEKFAEKLKKFKNLRSELFDQRED